MTYFLLALGFVFLIKGADILVQGSASLAKRFNISNIVIGLTIVAFGTSMPEFVVSVLAAYQKNTDISIGNILGSNIANTLLILGTTSIIYPVVANRNTVLKEIPFSLLAAFVMALLANDALLDGESSSSLGLADGLILLSFFVIFLYYVFGISKSELDVPPIDAELKKKLSPLLSIVYVILGISGLILGGKWIVDCAVEIAKMFNLSEGLIAVTVVAIGTSLPELATSVAAALKKESDIAIGNVVGSNIFNVFWILGVSSTVNSLPFYATNLIDLGINIMASLLLFLFMFLGKKHTLERWEGFLLLTLYFGYMVFLIVNQS
jgi:cation:H+ antiporter